MTMGTRRRVMAIYTATLYSTASAAPPHACPLYYLVGERAWGERMGNKSCDGKWFFWGERTGTGHRDVISFFFLFLWSGSVKWRNSTLPCTVHTSYLMRINGHNRVDRAPTRKGVPAAVGYPRGGTGKEPGSHCTARLLDTPPNLLSTPLQASPRIAAIAVLGVIEPPSCGYLSPKPPPNAHARARDLVHSSARRTTALSLSVSPYATGGRASERPTWAHWPWDQISARRLPSWRIDSGAFGLRLLGLPRGSQPGELGAASATDGWKPPSGTRAGRKQQSYWKRWRRSKRPRS